MVLESPVFAGLCPSKFFLASPCQLMSTSQLALPRVCSCSHPFPPLFTVCWTVSRRRQSPPLGRLTPSSRRLPTHGLAPSLPRFPDAFPALLLSNHAPTHVLPIPAHRLSGRVSTFEDSCVCCWRQAQAQAPGPGPRSTPNELVRLWTLDDTSASSKDGR